MKPFVAVFLTLTFFQTGLLKAQTTTTFSGWLAEFGRVELGNKYSLHIEAQLRSTNEWENIQTLVLRGGLNYNLRPNQVITIGYGYFSNRRVIDGVTGYVPEDRIWEQYSFTESFSFHSHFVTIQNRFRLEQRFIGQASVQDNQLVTDSFAFAQRIRYFARMIVPLGKSAGNTFLKGTYISLQDEVFVNFGDISVVNGKYFDQNRAYFSIGYRFSAKNDTEIGYMNQYVLGQGSTRVSNNILQLATYIRL